MKRTFAQILEEEREDALRRLSAKVPEWDGSGLELPVRLSIEQCSSSRTAFYKASLAASLHPGARILDLTGGLGVDTWAFSREASSVTYVERNPELAALAGRNFGRLALTNVTTICGDCRDHITEADIIYLDPARRSGTGRKVFKLGECEPDVRSLLPRLLEAAPHVIIKLSPMADVTELGRELGEALQEVHILGAGGEVKEVIAVLGRSSVSEPRIIASDGRSTFSFLPQEERDALAAFPESPQQLVGGILFEPDAVLLKAGCFKLLASRAGLVKLGRHTHLYLAREEQPFGKCRHVRDVLPLDSRTIKSLGETYPDACVTARNIPLDSEGLRKKMGVTSSGGTHIFGVTIDSATRPGRYLVVTEKAL